MADPASFEAGRATARLHQHGTLETWLCLIHANAFSRTHPWPVDSSPSCTFLRFRSVQEVDGRELLGFDFASSFSSYSQGDETLGSSLESFACSSVCLSIFTLPPPCFPVLLTPAVEPLLVFLRCLARFLAGWSFASDPSFATTLLLLRFFACFAGCDLALRRLLLFDSRTSVEGGRFGSGDDTLFEVFRDDFDDFGEGYVGSFALVARGNGFAICGELGHVGSGVRAVGAADGKRGADGLEVGLSGFAVGSCVDAAAW